MSKPDVEPQANPQENPPSRVITRRDFLIGAGLVTVGAVSAELTRSPVARAAAASTSPLRVPGAPEAGEALAENAAYIIPAIYETPQEAITEAEIAADSLNIRPEASTDKPAIGQLLKGSRVKIVRENVAPYPQGSPNSFWAEIEDTMKDGRFIDDGVPEFIVNLINGEATYVIVARGEAVSLLPPTEPIALTDVTHLFAPLGTGVNPIELDKQFAEAVGIPADENGEFVFDPTDPYIGFLRLEHAAARGAITNFVDSEDNTEYVTVGRVGDEQTGKTLRVFVKKLSDNSYEMISSRIGNGLFTYRKIDVDDQGKIAFGDSSIISGK
ncbi:MAG: SH3 domain-containing protein, partial [Candidatus Roizmanbacteria bacterium]|nr:SH3 domain-containing protein [Candidatus Roizmanbacteria bacterium]